MRTLTLLFCLCFTAPVLKAQDTLPPTIANVIPAQNSAVVQLSQIEVFFSEDVQGVEAGDLMINGVAATNVVAVSPNTQFRFDFAQPPTGTVQVAWTAAHGITDVAGNPFGGGTWTYTLNPALALYFVRINEFLASNSGNQTNSIRDEDGAASDWIELYNGSPITVNLAGCYLTDDKGDLRQWEFPAYSLPANTYLIVWASNKDRTNVFAPLHTNFRLAAEPGFLALIDPSGTNAISIFDPYPEQRSDVSYGRDPLDPRLLGFYTRTTPGGPNATAGSAADFAPDVVFSVESSTFVNNFNLVLSTPSPSAVIRYIIITNGTPLGQGLTSVTNVPTTNSPIYSGPILINQTTQVRTRAFETGKLPGTPVSHTYFQLSPNVTGFSSDLPIVIVNNFAASATLPTTDQTMVLASFESGFGRSSLTNKPNLVTRGAANDRGSSTAGRTKQNMAVEFWDEFNQDTDLPLLGMPAESDWVFYGINGFDPGLMHNAIFHWFGQQLPGYNSRTRYVEVFRKTNLGPISSNDYFGLFLLEEKPKRNDNRVNIPALRAEDTNGVDVTGGYLLRIDRTDPDEHFFSPPQINTLRTTPAAIVIDYPARTGTPSLLIQSNYIYKYLLNFLTNLSVTNISQETGYPAYIETDSWIDNLVANIICYNVDGYRLSGYFFKDRGRRLEQGPLWDCDRCLGTGGSGGQVPETDARPFNPRQWRVPTTSQTADNGTDFFGRSTVGVSWFEKLFSDPDFWQKWIDRYQTLRTNEYSTTAVMAMVDGFHDQVREAQVREQARWSGSPTFPLYPRAGVNSANGYSYNFGPANPAFARGGYFTNEVNFQKQWLLDRFEFLDTNFLAMPVLGAGSAMVTTGTVVTVLPAAKANTLLLYTLDGTDPRLPGGAISPLARTNVGPLSLTISNNVRLFARCYNTSHANVTNAGSSLYGNPILNSFWSGPVAATYYVSIPPLRITELMYHPADPPPGIATNDSNFEYIEVRNIGITPLNVNRFRLRGGVDFDFPNQILVAGESAVIVHDVAAFQSRYGSGPRILGVYTNDSLSNDGERIALQGSVHEPILDFVYDDQWYPITDGQGFSLQIIDQNAPPATWGLQSSWRPSGVLQGTPGASDPGPLTIPTIYVNEVLSNTDPLPGDAIELYNPTANPVNIGGWYLTDSFSNPRKYRIPNNTTIPANGYLVFYQSNSFGLGSTGFGLSSQGEEAYLFSVDSISNFTGWAHGFDYGPQASGVTFGRVVISTGDDRFVAQISPTLGAANSGPKVGPIVVSEINYHPPDLVYGTTIVDNDIDEYVELRNISGSPAPLYDPLNPANTWRLRSAVDFIFPPGVVLAPGAFLLVVSFDPSDVAALSSFKAINNVPDGIPIYGPWSGKLDNSADDVELARPDLPIPPGSPSAGFVPYILADKVAYDSVAPWPTNILAGFGYSLHRIDVAAYGNDPANWRETVRTAGTAAPPFGGTPPQVVTHPVNVLAGETYTATFSVTATGTSPLTYQWLFNGVPLRAADSPVLMLSNLKAEQSGSYSCRVFNQAGAALSSSANLIVRVLPRIVPAGANVFIKPDAAAANLPNGTNVTFSVVSSAQFPPITYQWTFNGVPIPGATSTSVTITNIQLESEGDYACAVSETGGTVSSLPARLVPWIRPIIQFVSPPPIEAAGGNTYTNIIPAGSTINFAAVVFGNPPPFGYVWRSNSFSIITNFTDSATNVFPFKTGPTPITATYRVIVTNPAQPNVAAGVWSAAFYIRTVADNDQDGISDEYEVANGFDTNNAADALGDLDLDGSNNRAEFIAGTDPNNNQSYLKVELDALPGAAAVEVSAVANRSYSVQYTDALGTGQWLKLGDVFPRATNRVEVITDPNWTTNRFYRLVVPQQP